MGPADTKPSLGDIGPGARRSRYRCERQPKRAIVHTGIPQRPPRGARPARAPWQPNLATEDSVIAARKCPNRVPAVLVCTLDLVHNQMDHPNALDALGAHNARVRLCSPLTASPCNRGPHRAGPGTATTRAPSVLSASGRVRKPTHAPSPHPSSASFGPLGPMSRRGVPCGAGRTPRGPIDPTSPWEAPGVHVGAARGTRGTLEAGAVSVQSLVLVNF